MYYFVFKGYGPTFIYLHFCPPKFCIFTVLPLYFIYFQIFPLFLPIYSFTPLLLFKQISISITKFYNFTIKPLVLKQINMHQHISNSLKII